MPYYPVNTNKRTERKLTLGQLITMATRLMKSVYTKSTFKQTTFLKQFLFTLSQTLLFVPLMFWFINSWKLHMA